MRFSLSQQKHTLMHMQMTLTPTSSAQMDATVVSHRTNSIFNIAQIETLPITSSAIGSATRRDKLLSRVCRCTKQVWPSHFDDMLRTYCKCHHQLTVGGDGFMWGTRVVIPNKHQPHTFKEFHRDLPGRLRMKSLAHSYVWWPGMDKDIENMAKFTFACPVNRTNISD